MLHSLQLPILPADRIGLRRALIQVFLDEEAGHGTGKLASKYHYCAEQLPDNQQIYLKRPAALNKGMDFTVHVQGYKFRQRGLVDAPSHANLFHDLELKQAEHAKNYAKLKKLLKAVYQCETVTLADCQRISFASGMTVAQVVFTTKWLFIEQDVTYWNWSGRAMLWQNLQARQLC